MFLPEPTPHGGSRAGNSHVSLWVNCPRKWFFTFRYPMSDGEQNYQGISSRVTAPALLGGSVFHEMMAAYYTSGVRDGEDTGEYDLSRAIEAGLAHHHQRKHEYFDQDEAEKNLTLATEMMTGYYEAFGPGGPRQDYPTIKVVCNEQGEPYIEKEFTIQLGYKDYIYTARLDAVIEHHGFLKVLEHKSSAASWVRRTLAGIHRKSQFTGEVFVVTNAFPDHELNGCMVNVCVKGRSVNSQFAAAERDTTGRTPKQLERFRLRVIGILSAIDDHVNLFEKCIGDMGMDVMSAADKCFGEYGEYNDYCTAYNRECEFTPFCKGVQDPDISLRSFRPRTLKENVDLKEYGG